MNNPSKARHPLLSLPNLLTCFRFFTAPILIWLAWQGYKIAFLMLLALAFLSDALDGFVARWKGEVSQLGAKLDSWADMVNYCTVALGSWWLWPEMIIDEAPFVALIVASYLLPPAVGIIKFGTFTSYHTWIVKLAALSVGLSFYILFLGGPAWPFRFAAFVCIVAAAEEIAISIIAPEPYSNVSSLRDVKQRLASLNKAKHRETETNS
ncbi:MAG: CDP-alcohol phosphatidyltransferase family protein [Gammaproteobacteria bacterium]